MAPIKRLLRNIMAGAATVLAPQAGSYSHYKGRKFDCAESDLDALKGDVSAIGDDFHKACELGRELVKAQPACEAGRGRLNDQQ